MGFLYPTETDWSVSVEDTAFFCHVSTIQSSSMGSSSKKAAMKKKKTLTKDQKEKATQRKLLGREKAKARKAARKAERDAAGAKNPVPSIATGHRNLLLSEGGKKKPCFNYFWMSTTKNDIKEFLTAHKEDLDDATTSKLEDYSGNNNIKTNQWRNLAYKTFQRVFSQEKTKKDEANKKDEAATEKDENDGNEKD